MAKDFTASMHFDAAPDVVFAAQSDPEYVVWKHEHMYAHDVSADVVQTGTSVVVSSSRKLPAELPSAAKSLVGDAITVNEVHTWSYPDVTGAHTGTVEASFPGVPISVTGTLALRPEGTGSVLEVAITSKSSVPLIGGKLEQIVGEQFMKALTKEEKIAPQWFAE